LVGPPPGNIDFEKRAQAFLQGSKINKVITNRKETPYRHIYSNKEA
jgi:hypothetical protein